MGEVNLQTEYLAHKGPPIDLTGSGCLGVGGRSIGAPLSALFQSGYKEKRMDHFYEDGFCVRKIRNCT